MVARVRAPDIGGDWVNTEPLRLADLRGKVVLLHFWTSSCISCLRVLDELRVIEESYPLEVVLVGVHSPKFPREHDAGAVRDAVVRHRIRHPVVSDPELHSWRQYGVKGWPTVVVIDPEAYVVGGVSGEGVGEVLTGAVAAAIEEHDTKGTLTRGPVPPVTVAGVPGPLAFPGKVASDGGRRLAIADTGHDRVLVTDLGGRLEWEVTGLSRPQGIRFDGDSVVICDSGADRVVRARTGPEGVSIDTLATGLASPWDVVGTPDGGWLVAEAARHRLWRVDRDGEAEPEAVAGSGREDLADGPANEGALARPSGLARVPGGYAVADADTSALRVVTDDGRLTTLVGHGRFEWGDSDGGRDSSRMQHPLGVVAVGDGAIVVTDTFNGRLRMWRDGSLVTLAGDPLCDPGGADVLPDGRLVVADTGHHRVVTVDPATGLTVPVPVDDTWSAGETGPPVEVAAERPLMLAYDVGAADADLDRSAGHPVRVVVESDPPWLLAPGPRRWDLSSGRGTVEVVSGSVGAGTVVIEAVAAAGAGARGTLHRTRRRHSLTVR